jgi:hypothetical protein
MTPRSKASIAFKWAPLALLALTACKEPPPDKLAMDPSGPFHFEKKGATEDVKIAAFRGKQPVPEKVPVEWKSSDTSVATVDEKGHITATGSGKTTITAEAWNLTTTAEVSARIVGSLAVADDVPKPLKLSNKGVQLHITVKDDKGNVIEKPEHVGYRATDYCVEVSDDGFVKPLAEGDCAVDVNIADKYAKLNISVKE